MKLLTKGQHELFEKAKISYICKEIFENKYLEDKKVSKLEIIVFIQENIEPLPIAYVT